MSKKLLIISILLISIKVSAQIELEHVYDRDVVCPRCTTQVRAFNTENNSFYYTSGYSGIFIFNSDHSLYKEILPESENVGFEKVYFPSDKLFNNDNLIEFIVLKKTIHTELIQGDGWEYEQTKIEKKILVMNENGEILQTLGQKDGELKMELEESERIKYFKTIDNKSKIIVNCADSVFIYNVNGSLTSTQLKAFSQEPIKIFPNPSKSIVTISGDFLKSESSVKVFSLNGRLLKTVSNDCTIDSITIDISDLTPGTYVFRAGSEYGKFIKN